MGETTAASDKRESWNSRLGVILAVAGSAVGLGNFLRFPGKAAEYGGGAFMIAYFVSLLLLGLPICWAEWTMGRHGGRGGFNSSPAIFAMFVRKPRARYLGIIGVIVPVVIYMYYVNIEAWCLGYAAHFLLGDMRFETVGDAGAFFGSFVGIGENGGAFTGGIRDSIHNLLGMVLHAITLDREGTVAYAGAFVDGLQVGEFLVICFFLNFLLIYRGLSRGIELFCKYAMPTLLVIAFIILIRVLTLGTPDPAKPYNNVDNGLGFMWNPNKVQLQEYVQPDPEELQRAEALLAKGIVIKRNKLDRDATQGLTPEDLIRKELLPNEFHSPWHVVRELVGPRAVAEVQAEVDANPNLRIREVTMWQQLLRPELWLAAAGQIFFSLSVGFGVILTYASYLKRDDDIVLSGLSATAANEFAEVGLGGLISLPAGIAFLGAAGVAGMGTFGLGFNVLPMVFSVMPGGQVFGFLFFFLLFLAAVTSSLSMLQPGIAFLEDAYRINRRRSVALLGLITLLGSAFVAWFSKDLKALDTLDFWVGTFLIFVLATIQIIVFSWVRGIDSGFKEAHVGAAIRIPRVYKFIMRWVTPTFLLLVISLWVYYDVLGGGEQVSAYIRDLWSDKKSNVALMSVALVVFVGLLTALVLTNPTLAKRIEREVERTGK